MSIMLEIAVADREQAMWERRFKALRHMYGIDRRFVDQGGKWGLCDALEYASKVCGFPLEPKD